MTAVRARVESDISSTATVVERLAVLLSAGVPPTSAWSYLDAHPIGRHVAERLAEGVPIGEALLTAAHGLPDRSARPWRALAAAWEVATRTGAPLAECLRQLAHSFRSMAQAERDIATALAGPAATARLVVVLPGIGILFSLALGFDTIGALLGSSAGWGCLVTGSGLLVVGRWWTRRLQRSARPSGDAPGFSLDLMAIAVTGGASLERARRAVEDARRACGIERGDEDAGIDDALALSKRAGVPAGELLRNAAIEARRDASSAAQQQAAALAVRLLLPLGACVLPAFLALAVAPMMLAVVSSTVVLP